jgi:hypothetical protein
MSVGILSVIPPQEDRIATPHAVGGALLLASGENPSHNRIR